MRPASGQGGSMAFEDAVILCRVLQRHNEQNNGYLKSQSSVEEALHEYETNRLLRIRKLWEDQWERSEAVYRNIQMEPWSPEFSEWVFQGV
jgi:2-polyprenyl-6-methoxyphenol hydroxylase-like FAD-dependent oxidoreductase